MKKTKHFCISCEWFSEGIYVNHPHCGNPGSPRYEKTLRYKGMVEACVPYKKKLVIGDVDVSETKNPIIEKVDFTKSNIDEIEFPEFTILKHCRFDNMIFKNKVFKNIYFDRCYWYYARLISCDLTGCIFDLWDSERIYFNKSNLNNVEFISFGGCGCDPDYDFLSFANTKNFKTIRGLSKIFHDFFYCEGHSRPKIEYLLKNVGVFEIENHGKKQAYLNHMSIDDCLYNLLSADPTTITDKMIKDALRKYSEFTFEIINKVDFGRAFSFIGKIIDKENGYKLHKLKLNDENLLYLEMINPSTEERHYEGVPPGTKTINQALTFRNGMPGRPKILT